MSDDDERSSKSSAGAASPAVTTASSADGGVRLPQKKYFRQRAHCNPLALNTYELNPSVPDDIDWSPYYPGFFPVSATSSTSAADGDEPPTKLTKLETKAESTSGQPPQIEFLDVGCGYGGLLMSLATRFPRTLMLGMEIRSKVSEYVKEKIRALRLKNANGQFMNVWCIRANAMFTMRKFFREAQLSKLFFLYPDPHFKKKKHKWRIVNDTTVEDYAFVLRPGGIVYTVTDVKPLHEWMVDHFERHAKFARIGDDEASEDEVARIITDCTEEGQKVTRGKGEKFVALFRRVE